MISIVYLKTTFSNFLWKALCSLCLSTRSFCLSLLGFCTEFSLFSDLISNVISTCTQFPFRYAPKCWTHGPAASALPKKWLDMQIIKSHSDPHICLDTKIQKIESDSDWFSWFLLWWLFQIMIFTVLVWSVV